MVTVTLDEITLNAVKAALDERVKRLEIKVDYWQAVADHPPGTFAGVPARTEDAQRALVWNIAALHETKLAREQLSDPEQADPITAAKAYADLGYHDAQARYSR